MIIDPRGLNFSQWASATAFELASVVQPMIISTTLGLTESWKDWAFYMLANPTIASQYPPNPNRFTDWQDWAIRFNQAVAGLE